MRTLRLVVFVSLVMLFSALSPGFPGQAPARTDAAAPAKGAEPQQQLSDEARALDRLTGRVDAMQQAVNAAAVAGQTASQSADRTISLAKLLFALAAALAGVLAFLGYRSFGDLRRKAEEQFADMRAQAQQCVSQAEQAVTAVRESAEKADEYVKRMDEFVRQTEEKARSLSSLDPTKDMSPADKQQLEDLGHRLDLVEALGLPLDAKACLARGNDYFTRGDYASALACCGRAIGLKPDYVEAHYNRGVVLTALDRNAEALAAYDRAIELRPDLADAHCGRGAALWSLGRHQEALAAADRAIALKPDHAGAHCNRGAALWSLGRHQEALAAFDRALGIDPNRGNARYNRACALASLGRGDDALADLRGAVQLDPLLKDKAKTEPELESLRSDPDFRALVGLDDQPPAPPAASV